MEDDKISSAVDGIASDLGIGTEGAETDNTETTETVDTEGAHTGTETTDIATATAAPTPRSAPKAWAKEQHEHWSKLDPKVQDYIELREKQVLDGLGQYSEKAKRADEWDTAVKDYMPLIQAQGAKPQEAVRYLLEAHKNLAIGTPEQKAQYLAKVAKQYGIDMAKAGTVAPADEPPSVRELRERTERLERDREQERSSRQQEEGRKAAVQVSTFAEAKDEKGALKHPYFDECADHIVKLINAGYALEEAYETAIYANPVTKAKELERSRKADDEALRAKAKDEAEKARNASRSNVQSRDTRRQPTAPAKSVSMTLDAAVDEAFQEIKARTH